ncbi:hypothetical protein Curi_c10980 [Gottschalkia acidurici 9a]|uniref:Uncharacterized protein n=1 Tax=Gottschalkia acidurici (strain ATCC 7906 / DSM 604 / BCRC 14475 / CIP 104303 / KCTC 5404 / NCIMB 10678 / 9a) TaxID=1128398 RepID=K0AZ93_GOTA9|nr:hypothetical protein [Gottschalkia acidurici]AFS78112.1 hypothetical protein Curi_c10980 [Gottschalkia acidurici 9a]
MSKYEEQGQEISYFISDMLNKGALDINNLNDFLFDALFYGYHKEIFIWNIADVGNIVDNEEILEQILKENYDISGLNHNEISSTFFSKSEEKKEKMVAIKIYKVEQRIVKVRIIFATEIITISGGSPLETQSYIPIEINLDKKMIITKAYRKYNVLDEKFRYNSLILYFTNKIKNVLNISTEIFGKDHRRAIYFMCKSLVDEVFEKISGDKESRVDDAIEECSRTLEDAINISDIKVKIQQNNIFDIKSSINKMIQHILVSNFFYHFKLDEEISKFNGLVTYIKFNDGTVNAVVKGENSYKSVFISDAFMGLRKSMENKGSLNKLTLIWNISNSPWKVTYDTGDVELLKMQFYTKYDEGEFYYALDRYKEFESSLLDSLQTVDRKASNKI